MTGYAIDNRKIVKDAYDSLLRGDLEGFLKPLAPQVQWREAQGLSLTGGEYRGREVVVEKVLGPFTSRIAGLAVEPETIIADGDTVVVLGRYQGTAVPSDRPIDVPFAHVWQLQYGVVWRFTQLTDTALLNQAFEMPLVGALA